MKFRRAAFIILFAPLYFFTFSNSLAANKDDKTSDTVGSTGENAVILKTLHPPFSQDISGVCGEGQDCEDDVEERIPKVSAETGLKEGKEAVKPSIPLLKKAAKRDAPAQPVFSAPGRSVDVYFFWRQGCRHCKKQSHFLDALKNQIPELSIHRYEIGRDKKNSDLLMTALKLASVKFSGVPVTIIGDTLWIGFNETKAKSMEMKILSCLEAPCDNPLDNHQMPAWEKRLLKTQVLKTEDQPWIDIPLWGRVNTAEISLPMVTVLIGAMDGFNPCAFFVLLFLLSMLIHAKSRPKMFLVGGLFVATSGVVYFLFMAAWLNLFLLVGEVRWVTLIAGIVALGIGAINVKDYFFWNVGMSLSISKENKLKIIDRMRGLLQAGSLSSLVAGTMVLAITANMYELFCTAGLPMVFTRILTLHELSGVRYYLYLALYNLIYVVPLAAIVIVFSLSMGARKLTEGEGRALKLLSGMLMLAMGAIFLIRPDILSGLVGTMSVLMGSVALSSLILLVHKFKKENLK